MVAKVGGVLAGHEPVMVSEVLRFLEPHRKRKILDATIGPGGHTKAILKELPEDGIVIGLDWDARALKLARENLTDFSQRIILIQANFKDMADVFGKQGLGKVDGVIYDLGLSSQQISGAERGFSFQKEGPLDMRINDALPQIAGDLINHLSEARLAQIFKEYGQERYARRIARLIIKRRKISSLRTTLELAQLAKRAYGRGRFRIHPATRIFQALRIAVNAELDNLKVSLSALPGLLSPKARVVVISYHSLEDRIVKETFNKGARQGLYRILTPKPLRPSGEEVRENPRSRSARLRAVESLPAGRTVLV
jgi:16S rRNA (cytosine1402-N4)-methyltransferase